MSERKEGRIVKVAGPVVVAEGMAGTRMYDVVRVGELNLIGEIVELHGGDIRIESETGKGTCFTVRLPAEPPNMPSNSSPTP